MYQYVKHKYVVAYLTCTSPNKSITNLISHKFTKDLKRKNERNTSLPLPIPGVKNKPLCS